MGRKKTAKKKPKKAGRGPEMNRAKKRTEDEGSAQQPDFSLPNTGVKSVSHRIHQVLEQRGFLLSEADKRRVSTTIEKTAHQVDGLVLRPAIMDYWRSQVEKALGPDGTIKSDTDLVNAIRDLKPKENILPAYTVLAFCHDDHLRLNPILTEKVKKLNPDLCSRPQILVYRWRYHLLEQLLKYVEIDLEAHQLLDPSLQGKASQEAIREEWIEKLQSKPKGSLNIRVAQVVTKYPDLNSTVVAKIVNSTSGAVRATKAWRMRGQFRRDGKVPSGSKDRETGAVEAVAPAEPKAEHLIILEMIQECECEAKNPNDIKYPAPTAIAQKLSTKDDEVSEERAKELLRETLQFFPLIA